MKKILSIIATSLLWVSSAEAGVPLIQEQGNSRYTIQLDSISMTIDANGGKILSFRYGNQEAISLAADGAVWYQPDVADQNRKINADGKGWLAYYNHGLLLLKKFQDLDVSQPAPEEAEIQVYVNRGKTYIELESQGVYTTLEPDQSLTWTVRWYLRRVNGDPTLPLLLEAIK